MNSTPSMDRAFGRMEGKLDLILTRINSTKEDVDKIEVKMDLHDDRLKKVEGRQSYFMGGAAAIGAISALMVKLWPFHGG